MVVYNFILVWFGLWAGLFIMKDLTDFVALGEKLGLKDDKLLTFAETKYDDYLKTLEKEAETAQKNYERDMRVLEKREKVAEAERSAVTESAGSGGARSSPHVPSFRFTPFNDKSDDLDSWFTLFEKQCGAYNVKEKDRKAHLLSLFSGQYRDAFLSLDADATFDAVRSHLLQTFNLTKHDYRKKFFDISPKKDENIVAYCQRLSVCFDKWVSITKIQKDFKSLRDLILTHKVFESCNPKLNAFLVERDCDTLKEVEENATRFFNAHADENLSKGLDFPFSANYAGQMDFRGRGGSKGQDRNRYGSNEQRSSSQNGYFRKRFDNSYQKRFNPRDKAQDLKDNPQPGDNLEKNTQGNKKEEKNNSTGHTGAGGFNCYFCGGRGHIKRVCPTFLAAKCTLVENCEDSVFYGLPDGLSTNACNSAKVMKDQHIYKGLLEIDGSMQPVRVLRDTGSMIHAIHKKLLKTVIIRVKVCHSLHLVVEKRLSNLLILLLIHLFFTEKCLHVYLSIILKILCIMIS